MPSSRSRPIHRAAHPLLLLVLGLVCAPIPCATASEVWHSMSTSGYPPTARRLQGMIVDEVGNRLVVVGGEHADDRTWALSLTEPYTWADLNVEPPPGAENVSQAIYDPAGRRMILLLYDCSVWALDLADPQEWVEIMKAGTGPPARRYPVVVHDSVRNRLVLFGGGPDPGLYNDVWALNLQGAPAWIELKAGNRPSARWAAVGVYDSRGDRLVVFSGLDEIDRRNDAWELSLANPVAWNRMSPSGLAPQARYLAAGVFDPATSEFIVFDGHNGTVALHNMWALDLSTPEGAWNELVPPGATPSARWSHRAVYSHTIASMITWGGWDGTAYRSDAWMLLRSDPGGPPRILGFSPAGGKVGDEVTIYGISLQDPLAVTIGGTAATVVTSSLGSIKAIVPAGASPGPITVTTATGTVVSEEGYFVGEAPVLERALPDSARAGETIELRGRALTSTTRISFGGTTAAPFTVLSDTSLAVQLDTLAVSGPIHVTTLVATTQSGFAFHVIADDPRPRLLSVRDVNDDQGGRVLLRWRASDFDKYRYRSITGYRVWRRAPLAATSELAAAKQWRSSRVLGLATTDPDVFWESIAELPATFLAGYAYTATTKQDSTGTENPYTAFFVQALTKDVFKFYNSSPDSGYSVDNLAPLAPTQVTVDYAPSGNTLHWRCGELADLHGYRVHRSGNAFFVPSGANLIATTGDTSHADIAGQHFYKIAAVDIHGNVSRYIAVSPDRPVATLASFFRAHREHGMARVTWFSGGNRGLSARVYRRTGSSDWEGVGTLFADDLGYLAWEDRAVADDTRYGYRLGVIEPGDLEVLQAETWVDPLAVAFAFAGRVVNPSAGGRVACTFAVPFGARAEVSLFDVAGREVERHVVEPGASGERTVRFGDTQRLRAGVYLVRASGAGRVVTKRVVVLD